MPQINVPRKIVSTIQLWASVLLIVLALVFSFTPIITLKTLDNAADINEMLDSLELDTEVRIPEEVEVSAPKLISSISLIVDIIGVSSDAANSEGMTDEQMEDLEARMLELEEYMKTDEGKEDIITALCIAVTIVKTVDFEDSENFFSLILNVLVSIVGLLAVLIVTLLVPVILAFTALVSILSALKNIKTPEKVSAKIGNKLSGMISMPLMLMLFQCVVPGMTYASGIVTICILSVVSVGINFVCSRLREYPKEQFKYLNVLQGPALVGIVGFLVFFFNLIKSGIFKAFTSGKFALYMTEALVLTEKNIEVNTSYMIDGILMFVYLAVVLGCTAYLDRAARRFSCTVKKERSRGLIGLFSSGKAKDNNLLSTILMLAIYIIPTYIAGAKHFYEDPTSKAAEGDASFLELTSVQEEALSAALVGIIIMIVAEIAVIVLKKVFCADLSDADREALMMGKAKSSDEIVAEAKKIVAEAEAKEAVATVVADEAADEVAETAASTEE